MTAKPAKSDFRKTNGRFESTGPGHVSVDKADVATVAVSPAPPPRQRPAILLPLCLLLGAVVYADRTGHVPNWPTGMVQGWIIQALPESVMPFVSESLLPAAKTATDGTQPGGRRTRPRGPEPLPVPVLAEMVRTEDVPVSASAVGTVQALATVTVRAQVDGLLTEIAFKDGQMVKKGEVLARIDARTFQAQFDQVTAKKAQDEAQLANAETDLARYQKLATTDYGTKQQADTQRATVAQLQALVRADQGSVDNARAILDYTTIRAPIDGRTGIRAVDQGNIVRSSDPAGIVVITQIQPITVAFNLPQQGLRAVLASMARGIVPVEALEADDRTVIDHGQIEVIDNQVDQTTGTIKLKATFPNAQNQLWPGQFVNVRVRVDTLKAAVVVPTAAIQRGPSGAYVFVVNADQTVKQTPVTVGRQDEALAVVTEGVQPPAQVVTTGFTRLTDGQKVSTGPIAPPPPLQIPANRRNGLRPPAPNPTAAPPPPQGQNPPAPSQGQTDPSPAKDSQPPATQRRATQGTTPDGTPRERRPRTDPAAVAPPSANPPPTTPRPAP